MNAYKKAAYDIIKQYVPGVLVALEEDPFAVYQIADGSEEMFLLRQGLTGSLWGCGRELVEDRLIRALKAFNIRIEYMHDKGTYMLLWLEGIPATSKGGSISSISNSTDNTTDHTELVTIGAAAWVLLGGED